MLEQGVVVGDLPNGGVAGADAAGDFDRRGAGMPTEERFDLSGEIARAAMPASVLAKSGFKD